MDFGVFLLLKQCRFVIFSEFVGGSAAVTSEFPEAKRSNLSLRLCNIFCWIVCVFALIGRGYLYL